MDLRTGAVPWDEAVPDGRIRRWMEATPVRAHLRVCPDGISDGQEEGCHKGGFLYSDRRSTSEKGAVRCQLRRWREGRGCSCNRATGRRPKVWW